ncbi:MAG: 1-(5-phosphoribosyl)-5-[(5-phosphoribosylamino) methylideneamino] imidazole-4-carboxamide isomerase [Porticoccaceae bacterium]|nr:MAG: 1-(5-phosphoribosyl)-5-[(5-phosphoribosylamino) methylideneamino] imidazole-4-carboxamide isomerase [Porticoccaceae bacterium]
MLIIPAIDLKGGKCVRLRQGRMEEATVYSDNPVDVARHWVEDQCARRLHLVDLEGAFAGRPVNGNVVRAIAHEFPELPIQVGGGIRDLATIEYYLEAGVRYVILGTAAVKNPTLVEEACLHYRGHVLVGIDARDGRVAVEGWAEVSELPAAELARRLADVGVSAVVYTDIGRDGMLSGVNVDATVALARAARLPVIASGGVRTLADIEALCAVAREGILGVVVGRAIYEGTLNVREAQEYCDRVLGLYETG